MKRILILAVLLVAFVGCKQEPRTDFVINGIAQDVYNGSRVYLKDVSNLGREVYTDTAIVMDGKFILKGSVNEPKVRFLEIQGIPGEFLFMLENSEIEIEINKQLMLESTATGSKTHNDLVAYQGGIKELQEENRNLINTFMKYRKEQDTARLDSMKVLLEDHGQRFLKFPAKYVKDNNDSYFSLNLIGLEANKKKFDIEDFLDAYDNLTPSLKNTPMGGKVKRKLDSINTEYQKTAHLQVGKIAPSFEAPKPDGTIVSLEELKGKVTIIDFWAAWCGPCRRENPNIVKIYNEYHDKGLEIIGVSLDGNSRQSNPKKAWLDAIEKDKLAWTQVSHLKYFNDPVARLYDVNAIPATYILDKDGKIVAKNLRGRQLESKIQQLFMQ
ncbi:TlpA disulfide reductase family protein [Winogradskyella sp. KYW1333]|uniref:TlpA disulfide reductase family protein n=1 Tax=Winogradskyella sp. KYW1333 TaxID=2282123 RepID=UPI000DF4185C|nr:TlpA disulfide reductase family protein [Winogradskyella sp. KYW1333]RCT54588.1 AhpC/TSA family protein [Winogradskyella sp. KYW1333]